MSTIDSLGIPPGMLAQTSSLAALDKKSISADSSESEASKVARSFEAMLIHNMLKSMRRAANIESPSNARSIYDDMLDQRLSEVMSEAGGLGIAEAISRKLDKRAENHKAAVAAATPALMSSIQVPPAGSAVRGNTESELPATQTVSRQQISEQLAFATRLLGAREPQNAQGGTPQKFVHGILADARAAAHRLGTRPEAVIAVAALESGWGEHTLRDRNGRESHNLFGIKTHSSTGAGALATTTEFRDGIAVRIEDKFRTYSDVSESVDDFVNFLQSNPRYKKALELAGNPESFLKELQNAGYATDPNYASKAIRILRQVESYISGASL